MLFYFNFCKFYCERFKQIKLGANAIMQSRLINYSIVSQYDFDAAYVVYGKMIVIECIL